MNNLGLLLDDQTQPSNNGTIDTNQEETTPSPDPSPSPDQEDTEPPQDNQEGVPPTQDNAANTRDVNPETASPGDLIPRDANPGTANDSIKKSQEEKNYQEPRLESSKGKSKDSTVI